MLKKLLKGLKDWWDNNKNVVLNFVLPKLQSEEAISFIASGMKISKEEAKRFIAVIIDFLKRQV